MKLIEKVKKNLRISTSALDVAEISPLIAAAKKDLRLSGITRMSERDPLIQRAVVTYCKAHFGYDNPDSDKFKASYESIKNTLTQIDKYKGGAKSG